jgi:hypothetical protein
MNCRLSLAGGNYNYNCIILLTFRPITIGLRSTTEKFCINLINFLTLTKDFHQPMFCLTILLRQK